MNVERVELTNFGSWADLDLPISPGVSLIQGSNGSGKSTILAAVEFALFGATSDAGRLIRRGTDEAVVRVYLETEQGKLIVARRARRSGTTTKVTLHLIHEEITAADSFKQWNMTAATVTETQAVLDDWLGVSRETLRASAWSMQGDGGMFCEARPSERKRLLVETMPSLALWPILHEAAKLDAKAASDAASVASAELERLDGAAGRLEDAQGARFDAGLAVGDAREEEKYAEAKAERLAAEAEAAREARRQHAAAVEVQQRAQADHARATQERAAADEALERARSAAANAPSVEDARALVAVNMDWLGEAQERHEFAVRDAQGHAQTLADARHVAATAKATFERASEDAEDLHVRWTTAKEGTCAECGQPLVSDEARANALRLKAAYEIATAEESTADHALRACRQRVLELKAAPPDETYISQAAGALNEARHSVQAATTALAEAETIQSLAGSIEAAETRAREAAERENETANALRDAGGRLGSASTYAADMTEFEADHAHALTVVSHARQAHSTAAAELARAEEAAKHAEQQAAQETAVRERLALAEQEAAIAGILSAGFGPTGVPALIVDSVLGDLADEANRVLAELASPIRCELRSQRVTKDNRLVDALEIIALIDAMEAPYETLSGGERTRLALALRAALTRLLASKRGARVRLLVVDEPAGLDSTGCEQLAGVLEEFVAAGVFDTILLVTHQAELAEQIGRVVRIEKSASGVSRLADSAPQFPETLPVSDGDVSNGSSSGGDRPVPSGARMGTQNA